jgi:hypothetical protein
MDRKFDLSFFLQSYSFFIVGTVLGILILFIFLFYPYFYDFFVGDEIVGQHIIEVVGNTSSANEIALELMEWHHENVRYPQVTDKELLVAG